MPEGIPNKVWRTALRKRGVILNVEKHSKLRKGESNKAKAIAARKAAAKVK